MIKLFINELNLLAYNLIGKYNIIIESKNNLIIDEILQPIAIGFRMTKNKFMDEQQQKKYSYKITTVGWVVIGIIIIAVSVCVYFLVNKKNGGLGENKSEWQAIFMDNDHTYFGQIFSENKDSVIIKNIYYLAGMTNPQKLSEDEKNNKDFSLIKLGSEVHGPFDEMKVNRTHILFVEDLRADSKIVKAIEDYQNKK